MMGSHVRIVKYSIWEKAKGKYPQPYIIDPGKQKTGHFHMWGKRKVEDTDMRHSSVYAVVEDCETGKVYEVEPSFLKFIREGDFNE